MIFSMASEYCHHLRNVLYMISMYLNSFVTISVCTATIHQPPTTMIKKRSRPQQRVRERSISHEEEAQNEEEGETTLPSASPSQLPHRSLTLYALRVSEILELRKLRKAREGIDVAKLHKGDVKKKKKRLVPEEEVGGLRQGAAVDAEDEE